MTPEAVRDEQAQAWLPKVARHLVEQGFNEISFDSIAAACQAPVAALERVWRDETEAVVAAIEYAYDSAESVWRMLLRPQEAALQGQRLLTLSTLLGDDFSVSRMFDVGHEPVAEPRVRAALRRMNRRLARFLAAEVSDLHMAALSGDYRDESLQAQISTVLHRLAHIQQEADELADATRAELFEDLESAVRRSTAQDRSPAT